MWLRFQIKPLVYGGKVWPYNELAGFKSMRLDNRLFCAAWAAAACAAVVWLTWFSCPSWFNWEWFKAAKEDFDGFNDGIDLLKEPAIGIASWCFVFTMWQLKSFKMNEYDDNVLQKTQKTLELGIWFNSISIFSKEHNLYYAFVPEAIQKRLHILNMTKPLLLICHQLLDDLLLIFVFQFWMMMFQFDLVTNHPHQLNDQFHRHL